MFLENAKTTNCNDRPFGPGLRVFFPEGPQIQLGANVDNYRQSRRTSLPVGWRDRPCPRCLSKELVGALISESADSMDPDVLCIQCGNYF